MATDSVWAWRMPVTAKVGHEGEVALFRTVPAVPSGPRLRLRCAEAPLASSACVLAE
jgi:hypothetical protein